MPGCAAAHMLRLACWVSHMRLQCVMGHAHSWPKRGGWQVATDTRLWLHNALQETRGYLAQLIQAAVARSEAEVML